MSDIIIRAIQPEDNPFLANIVRTVLTEHGLAGPGTASADKTLDELYTVYQQPRSGYLVALDGETVIGGAGFSPLANGADTICELQKMYLLPASRGKGIARNLIEQCLELARSKGYKQMYLETMLLLEQAIRLYEFFGFRHLTGPMGDTGHYSCTAWMLKDL
jgi:putative acetyltransferase